VALERHRFEVEFYARDVLDREAIARFNQGLQTVLPSIRQGVVPSIQMQVRPDFEGIVLLATVEAFTAFEAIAVAGYLSREVGLRLGVVRVEDAAEQVVARRIAEGLAGTAPHPGPPG
jgi:hypothetical protein